MSDRGVLPAGLHFCRRCGAVRGETSKFPDDWIPEEEGETIKSTCLCEGLVCESCARRNRRRPISDYYDPETGDWWHVPHFMCFARQCRECRDKQTP